MIARILVFSSIFATIGLLADGPYALADNRDAALQLVQEAFKCRTGVTANSTKLSADDIEWRGD